MLIYMWIIMWTNMTSTKIRSLVVMTDAALAHRMNIMESEEMLTSVSLLYSKQPQLDIISLVSLYLLYTCKRRARENCPATMDR